MNVFDWLKYVLKNSIEQEEVISLASERQSSSDKTIDILYTLTGGKFVWACASKMSHAIAWNTRNARLQKAAIV
jgi:hypothetical protein